MNKRILLAVAVASMFAAIPAAQAATATGNFDVTVNLASKCEITAGPADVAFTYTSFQTTAATGTGGATPCMHQHAGLHDVIDATSGTVSGPATPGLSAATATNSSAAQSFGDWLMVSGQAPAPRYLQRHDARVPTVTYDRQPLG